MTSIFSISSFLMIIVVGFAARACRTTRMENYSYVIYDDLQPRDSGTCALEERDVVRVKTILRLHPNRDMSRRMDHAISTAQFTAKATGGSHKVDLTVGCDEDGTMYLLALNLEDVCRFRRTFTEDIERELEEQYRATSCAQKKK